MDAGTSSWRILYVHNTGLGICKDQASAAAMSGCLEGAATSQLIRSAPECSIRSVPARLVTDPGDSHGPSPRRAPTRFFGC
jgi:hypothetical protein